MRIEKTDTFIPGDTDGLFHLAEDNDIQPHVTMRDIDRRFPNVFQVLGYDALMDTEATGKPRVIGTFEMCVNSILYLLFLKPGKHPSIPNLGIDIEQYLHNYAGDLSITETIISQLNQMNNRLQITGIDYEVYFDETEDGTNALLVRIEGNELLGVGIERPAVIIGITYDQLNRLYARRYHLR